MIIRKLLGQLIVSVGELPPEILKNLLLCVAAGEGSVREIRLTYVHDKYLNLTGYVPLICYKVGYFSIVSAGHREVGGFSVVLVTLTRY